MVKTLTIVGRPVTFRATAAVPRLYRIKFRRDIMQDMGEIQKALKQAEESDSPESNIPPRLLEMFEDVAFIMARHGDPENTPSTPEEWLDQFNTFSIYEIFPHILELWDLNTETQSRPKKKIRPTDRELTTPIFLLRCVQLGISLRDLELLTVGMVNDMYTEQQNDEYKYPQLATQEDFDRF